MGDVRRMFRRAKRRAAAGLILYPSSLESSDVRDSRRGWSRVTRLLWDGAEVEGWLDAMVAAGGWLGAVQNRGLGEDMEMGAIDRMRWLGVRWEEWTVACRRGGGGSHGRCESRSHGGHVE